jgi:DNA-binding NarL/FixJ family response regulator
MDRSGAAGELVVVTGEAWIGKTSVLNELVRLAEQRQWRIAEGRPDGPSAGLPLGVFVDALHRTLLAEHVGDEAEVVAARAALCGGPNPDWDDPAQRYRTFIGVSLLLERLAGSAGLLLVLDALQEADQLSVDLVDYLHRHPPQARVVVGVGCRTGQANARLSRLVMDLRSSARVVHVRLKPLPSQDCERLLPMEVGWGRRQLVRDGCGGNPGVLRALLDATAQPGLAEGMTWHDLRTGVPPPMPEGYLAELDGLAALTRRVATAGAVHGDDFDLDALGEIAQLDRATVRAATDELLDADIVRPAGRGRRFRFRDPVVRSLAYHSGSGDWLQAAHGRAAARMAPASPARASQLELVVDGGTDGALASELEAAASTVLFEAPPRAERWLRAAQRISPEPQAPRIQVLLAQAVAITGRLDASRRLLRTVCAVEPAAQRAAAVEWYAQVCRLLGRYAEARTALRRAPDGDEPLGLILERGCLALTVGATQWALSTQAARWLERAGEHPDLDDPLLHAQLLGMQAVVMANQRRIDDGSRLVHAAAETTDQLGDRAIAHRLDALYWLADAERQLGMLDRAMRHFDRALDIADRSLQGHLYGHIAAGLGLVHLARGETEPALVCAQRAELAAEWTSSRPLRVAALALRSQASGPARARPRPAESGSSNALLEILSRREYQIAVLVSEGCTNQQIATALRLSPKTVETYLARIFRKLDVTSRSQIAHLMGQTGRPHPSPASFAG